MKKYLCVILSLVLLFSLSVPLSAEDDFHQTELSFLLESPEPAYYVTIPDEFKLEKIGDSNYLEISAIGIEVIDGKMLSITIEATQCYDELSDRYITELWPDGVEPYDVGIYNFGVRNSNFIVYDIFAPDGEYVLSGYFIPGRELTSFIVDEIQYAALIIQERERDHIIPGQLYTGHIVFGVKLVDIP